jgi:hypothetical protein
LTSVWCGTAVPEACRNGVRAAAPGRREFVPQRLVAWMARALYNEPYLAAPITAELSESPDEVRLHYRLRFARRDHHIHVTGGKPAVVPGPESLEHFFKEHRWGFGTTRSGRGIRYEVAHPTWAVYPTP